MDGLFIYDPPGGGGGTSSGGFDLSLGGNTSGTLAIASSGTVLLAGGNNITLSQAGQSITISAANQSVQTQNVVDLSLSGNTSGALALISSGTGILAGGNNITLSQAGQSITISGPNTAAQTNQTLGLFAVGNTASTSTSTQLDARTISFDGAGIVSIGFSAGSLIVSATQSTGMAALDIGGNSTSAGAGFSTITSGTVFLAGGNNVTLSQNGASITISAAAGAAATLSRFYWPPFQFFPGGTSSNNANTIYSLQYLPIDNYVSFSRIDIPINVAAGSVANTSSAEGMYSAAMVLYSLNGSTFNPIVGASVSQTFIWQSTQTVFSNINGNRLFSFPIATLLSPGEYWAGFYISTTTSSTQTNLAFSIQLYFNQGLASGTFADLNSATNSSSNAQFVGALSSQPASSSATLQLSQFTFQSTQQARANVPLILRNY